MRHSASVRWGIPALPIVAKQAVAISPDTHFQHKSRKISFVEYMVFSGPKHSLQSFVYSFLQGTQYKVLSCTMQNFKTIGLLRNKLNDNDKRDFAWFEV